MEHKPLLESLGAQKLIESVTKEDVVSAQTLLAPFLKDYRHVDNESVAVLAYLFGVKQGIDDMFGELSGKTLAKHMERSYRMGESLGFTKALYLFGSRPAPEETTGMHQQSSDTNGHAQG